MSETKPADKQKGGVDRFFPIVGAGVALICAYLLVSAGAYGGAMIFVLAFFGMVAAWFTRDTWMASPNDE